MTSCTECLTVLSTARLGDLKLEPAVLEHCTTCPTCSEIAAQVQFAEQRLATTLAGLTPVTASHVVASQAMTGSDRLRRLTAARIFRGALAAFGLLLLGTYVKEEVFERRWPTVISKTVFLKCATPQAAVEIVSPVLRSDGASVVIPPGVRALRIQGVSSEVYSAITELDVFESRVCALPENRGVQTPPNPSGETPRKD